MGRPPFVNPQGTEIAGSPTVLKTRVIRNRASLIGTSCPDMLTRSWAMSGAAMAVVGVAKGPEVARMLQCIEKRWVAERFPSRERVEQLLDEELAAR